MCIVYIIPSLLRYFGLFGLLLLHALVYSSIANGAVTPDASLEPPLVSELPTAPACELECGTPCPQDPPTPAVSLSVRVPAHGAVGQELEYRIIVTNQSPAPAHHVIVRDPLPSNARFVRAKPDPDARESELIWKLGTLEPCCQREIVLTLIPTGQGDVKNCARVQFEHGQCVTTRIAKPGITLTKEGPTEGSVSEVLAYRLTVRNTGATPLTGVHLTDTLDTGLEHASGHHALSWEVGRLEPGQMHTVSYQATARATGKWCNRAAVVTDGGLREVAENCVTITEAKLALVAAGPARQYVNAAAAYEFTLSNLGTYSQRRVTVAATLPPGAQFVSASQGGSQAGNRVQWDVMNLAPGAKRTVDLVVRLNERGDACIRASARGERGPAVEAEACTEFIGVAGLLLDVVDTQDPVEVGAETKYVITVRNQGSAPTTHLRIVAQVPKEMDIVRVEGPAKFKQDGNKVTFESFDLPAQRPARFVVTVKAKTAANVRFKVDMSADQLTSGLPLHEEESTAIYDGP